MTLKETMKYNSGLVGKEVLNESIGRKANKVIDRLIRKIENKKEAKELVINLQRLSNKFEALDQKIKDAKGDEKKALKKEYVDLKNEYSKVLKIIRKGQNRDLLGKLGLGGLASLIIIFIGLAISNYINIFGAAEGKLANVNLEIAGREQSLSQAKAQAAGTGLIGNIQAFPEIKTLEYEINNLSSTREQIKDAIEPGRKLLGKQVLGAISTGGVAGVLKKVFSSQRDNKVIKELERTLETMKD